MSSAALPSRPLIREAEFSDVEELSLNMRREDREEIHHSSRGSPLRALVNGWVSTDIPWAIERGGRVVALFGVTGQRGFIGHPWMLGTDDLRRCWSLLRACRVHLDVMLLDYHYLTNAVWSKNTVHVEWIRWLGFHFEGSDIRNGETFLHFHRRYRPCANPQPEPSQQLQ